MRNTSDIAQRRALARATDDPEYRVRRAELIKTAAVVFRRKGYGAAKLQDIADEVGLDRASVYYYVSGKEELYQEVVAEAVQDNVAMVEGLRSQEAPAISKLSAFVEGLMASYERHYPYLYVYVQEDMAHMDGDTAWTRKMRELSRRFDDAVREIIQKGLDDGSLRSAIADARLLANAVIGMCNWSHRWYQPGGPSSASEVGRAFSALLLHGLARPD